MSQWPIDLDTESIQYDEQWYTRDELARRIKTMLDNGDFAVGKPSQALEQLTLTLSNLRTIAFKITPEMADAVQQAAARQGRTVGGLIREAISDYLGFAAMPTRDGGQQASPSNGRGTERVGRKPTDPEMPAVTITGSQALPPDLKTTQQMVIPPQVIAGPGAMKSAAPAAPVVVSSFTVEPASSEEAASAVSLSPKKKSEEEPERGWFGR